MSKMKREAVQRALVQPTLGKRLQAVRKAIGMTGAEVIAKVPGLNRSTLSEIENDVSKRTSYLKPLAAIYGLSEETLLRPDLGSLIEEQTIGERIQRRREEMNYTRKELAEEIDGLTYHALFMIETKGRQSDLIPRIVGFLGLHRREEETNASALLRQLRTDLFLESTRFCEIADCRPDVLQRAEDGDTAAAVRVILDLAQGLLQGLPAHESDDDRIEMSATDDVRTRAGYDVLEPPMSATVYDVDESGRIVLPSGKDMPTSLTMPDGQRLYVSPGDPSEGEYAMAVVERRGTRSGIVGTYVPHNHGREIVDPSNISHSIPPEMPLHRMLPFQEYLTV